MNQLLEKCMECVHPSATLGSVLKDADVYLCELMVCDRVSALYFYTFLKHYFTESRKLMYGILVTTGDMAHFKDYLTEEQYADICAGRFDDNEMLANLKKMKEDLNVYYD
jgi:hypothetical protein